MAAPLAATAPATVAHASSKFTDAATLIEQRLKERAHHTYPIEGTQFPDKKLSRLALDGTTVEEFNTQKDISDGPCAIFFLPGAFTPICSQDHFPEIARTVSELWTKYHIRTRVVIPNYRDVAHGWLKMRLMLMDNLALTREVLNLMNDGVFKLWPDWGSDLINSLGLGIYVKGRDMGLSTERTCMFVFGKILDVQIEDTQRECTAKSKAVGLLARVPDILKKHGLTEAHLLGKTDGPVSRLIRGDGHEHKASQLPSAVAKA